MPAVVSCVTRTHQLTAEQVKAIHAAQKTVAISPSRGRHSLLEGDLDQAVSLVEVTGFALERTQAEVRDGITAMFPPHVITGRLLALDAAGRAPRVRLDVASAPGVTKPNGKPDWPPETERCLAGFDKQLGHLLKIPIHRVGLRTRLHPF
jgi:hypothetical protein